MDGNERLKDIIDSSQRIVFFGGAGVSTESGIPDFRSEKGLYHAKNVYGRSPEELVSYTAFAADTEVFFDFYKNNMLYPDAEPNAAHRALAALEADGKLLVVITQNVDGLHQKAGSKNVYELHGSVHRNYCTDCGAFYDLAYILDPMHCGRDGENPHVPYCEKCGGLVKPDVVLYEEALDEDVIAGAVDAIGKADTLIVGGTSLVVYPAAGFLRYFRGAHLVLINLSATAMDRDADLVLREPIGEALAPWV